MSKLVSAPCWLGLEATTPLTLRHSPISSSCLVGVCDPEAHFVWVGVLGTLARVKRPEINAGSLP